MAQLGRVRSGDLVQCDVNGRVFIATVLEKVERQLRIGPVPGVRPQTYTKVTGRQVKKHWRLVQS